MKEKHLLTIVSLISIALLQVHIVDDSVRGWFPRGLQLYGVLATAVLLYGTLMLAERRSGYVIMIITGLFGVAMPYLHLKELGGEFLKASGAFFFIWTVLVVGTTGCLTIILSLRGLWNLRRGQSSERVAR